jgi:hypothetical protein
MVNMPALSAVNHGFEPWSGQTKDEELVFVASPLSRQHQGIGTSGGLKEHQSLFRLMVVLKKSTSHM